MSSLMLQNKIWKKRFYRKGPAEFSLLMVLERVLSNLL